MTFSSNNTTMTYTGRHTRKGHSSTRRTRHAMSNNHLAQCVTDMIAEKDTTKKRVARANEAKLWKQVRQKKRIETPRYNAN